MQRHKRLVIRSSCRIHFVRIQDIDWCEAAGNYVEPTIPSITAAADASLQKFGADTDYRVSIVNAPGADSYPISSFTWLLVYETQRDATKAKKLTDFMSWMYASGGPSAAALDYAPLPASLVTRLTERLRTIQVTGAQ